MKIFKSKWKLRYMSVTRADFFVFVSKEWVKNGKSKFKNESYFFSDDKAKKYSIQFIELQLEHKAQQFSLPADLKIGPTLLNIEPTFLYF